MEDKYWYGSGPDKCDVCGGKIEKYFVDGKLKLGPWAKQCLSCFQQLGVGILGTDLGQIYRKEENGKWLRIGG
jgi:hypothetical protein